MTDVLGRAGAYEVVLSEADAVDEQLVEHGPSMPGPRDCSLPTRAVCWLD